MKVGDKAIITEYEFGFKVGTKVTLMRKFEGDNVLIWDVENDGKKWVQTESGMELIKEYKKPSLIKRFVIWLLTPLMEDYTSTHFRDRYFEDRAKASKA